MLEMLNFNQLITTTTHIHMHVPLLCRRLLCTEDQPIPACVDGHHIIPKVFTFNFINAGFLTMLSIPIEYNSNC